MGPGMKGLVPVILSLQLAVTSGFLGWFVLRPDGSKAHPAAETAASAAHRPEPHPAPDTAHPPPAAPTHAAADPHPTPAPAHAQAAPRTDPHGEPVAARSAAEVLESLLAGNRRFVAGDRHERAVTAERKLLASGQKPGAIILSCSDSRVPPELVFDQTLGDLFVVRTAGNVADAVALGSMEYAADHLHAELLVVMGHEKCGAVTAATQDGDVPSPNLKAVLDAIAPAVRPLKSKVAGAELVHHGISANVEASALHVVEASPVLRERVEQRKLTIKRAVYDLETGEVRFW